jgi:hypothetical protein
MPGFSLSRIQLSAVAYRRLAVLQSKVLRRYMANRRRYVAPANPYSVIWIDTKDVTVKLRPGVGRGWIPGTIEDGDWDHRVLQLSTSPPIKYVGMVEHFKDGLPWAETSLFKRKYESLLRERGDVLGFTSMEDLARYYESRIDPLFNKIRERGFMVPSVLRRVSAICIMIGRDGQLIAGDGGNHRFAIAKILELDSIPVRIAARHRLWQETRDRVAQFGFDGLDERLVRHPDLLDVRASAIRSRQSFRARPVGGFSG